MREVCSYAEVCFFCGGFGVLSSRFRLCARFFGRDSNFNLRIQCLGNLFDECQVAKAVSVLETGNAGLFCTDLPRKLCLRKLFKDAQALQFVSGRGFVPSRAKFRLLESVYEIIIKCESSRGPHRRNITK